MGFEELGEEQKRKARECKTVDELVELAKIEGIDLTEDQMRSISGGYNSEWDECENDSGCPRDS